MADEGKTLIRREIAIDGKKLLVEAYSEEEIERDIAEAIDFAESCGGDIDKILEGQEKCAAQNELERLAKQLSTGKLKK